MSTVSGGLIFKRFLNAVRAAGGFIMGIPIPANNTINGIEGTGGVLIKSEDSSANYIKILGGTDSVGLGDGNLEITAGGRPVIGGTVTINGGYASNGQGGGILIYARDGAGAPANTGGAIEIYAGFNSNFTIQQSITLRGSSIIAIGGPVIAQNIGNQDAVSSIAPGASPFTYQNAGTADVDIIVSGGTVTNIQRSRDNITYYSIGGAAGGQFHLSPLDRIRVTYTVAPTMTLFPF